MHRSWWKSLKSLIFFHDKFLKYHPLYITTVCWYIYSFFLIQLMEWRKLNHIRTEWWSKFVPSAGNSENLFDHKALKLNVKSKLSVELIGFSVICIHNDQRFSISKARSYWFAFCGSQMLEYRKVFILNVRIHNVFPMNLNSGKLKINENFRLEL